MSFKPFAMPVIAALLVGAAPPVTFTPVAPQFASASDDYRRLWEADGARISGSIERLTRLTLPPEPIEAIISEGRPMASFDGRTIRLRASYSTAYKKATLVHELGHRLAFTLPRRDGLDDHRLLYLFLYDAWTDLYGQAFAERMVSIERRIGPSYDDAWTWALAMTREQRQTRLAAFARLAAPVPSPDRSNLEDGGPLPVVAKIDAHC